MFGKNKDKPRMTQKQIYALIKNAFESQGIKYDEIKEKGIIQTGFMGDDLPIALNVIVDDTVIRFVSLLDFNAKPENFANVAWELNCINKNLAFGCFYLDPDDGYVMFEEAFPYGEAQVSESFILAFTKMVSKTVDKYDGDLKKIAEKVPRSSSRIEPMYG